MPSPDSASLLAGCGSGRLSLNRRGAKVPLRGIDRRRIV